MRSLRHHAGGTRTRLHLSGAASDKSAAAVPERGVMLWLDREPALPYRSQASLKYYVRQLRMAHNMANDPLVVVVAVMVTPFAVGFPCSVEAPVSAFQSLFVQDKFK